MAIRKEIIADIRNQLEHDTNIRKFELLASGSKIINSQVRINNDSTKYSVYAKDNQSISIFYETDDGSNTEPIVCIYMILQDSKTLEPEDIVIINTKNRHFDLAVGTVSTD